MAKILEFTSKPPTKLGFERVKKRKKVDLEKHGQLNLFLAVGRILHLPRNVSPFEEALMLDERGDRRAADLYWQAISQDDSIADAYCNLGILEFHAGRTTKAFDCFAQSLKHDPRHAESHYNLGNLYFEVGDLRLAQVHYEVAAELAPNFPNIYFNLGLVHAMNEDYNAAMEALNKYKELTPVEEGSKADELLTSLRRSVKANR